MKKMRLVALIWYSDTLTIRYNPKKVTKGEVMMKWN
ncbi:hypothetical protein Runsl_4876 [Runella slithyformis DSM 19594]|uniref:Uncharacterized protein n=1 Tax=Runella slithyformis (strain ATCC 29530 / DSM 19594 / LMG 11500 / NCIMB 11436 / LSU 4) TaxID=761193 RepID=A0A7U3ZPW7_RUNSL|nr:hypothetical protein Runsl_4876 [Runella slithyformis DSM 19594]